MPAMENERHIGRMPKRAKLGDTIVETLRREIATGARPVGSRLPPERDLAAEFGVSVPTVREALRVLGAMGLIDVRHGTGAFVSGDARAFLAASLITTLQIEQVTVLDALAVFELLLRSSARDSVSVANEDDIARLEEIHVRLKDPDRAPDAEAIAADIVAWQIALVRAGGNPLVIALESFLVTLMMEFRRPADRERGGRYWLDRSVHYAYTREAIQDALRRRDPAAMEIATREYIEALRTNFMEDERLAALRFSDVEAHDRLALLVHPTA